MTTIVSVDPMYAYFDMDEPTAAIPRTAPRMERRGLRGPGRHAGPDGGAGRRRLPARGTSTSSTTRSTRPRAASRCVVSSRIPAADASEHGCGVFGVQRIVQWTRRPFKLGHERAEDLRLLTPGMYVRIRLPIGQPHPALLIIDRAVHPTKDRSTSTCSTRKTRLQYRGVTTGRSSRMGSRVVAGGLNERVGCRRRRATGPTAHGDQGRAGSDADARQTADRAHAAESSPRATRARRERRPHDLVLLHRSADLRDGPIGRHHADRRDRSPIFLPMVQYPRIVPPGVVRLHRLPRCDRSGGGRHGGGTDRAAGQRRTGMLYMSSQMGNDGTYSLTVTFDLGTDLNTALVKVQNRVTLAMPQLPTPGPEPGHHDPEEDARHPDGRGFSLPTAATTTSISATWPRST